MYIHVHKDARSRNNTHNNGRHERGRVIVLHTSTARQALLSKLPHVVKRTRQHEAPRTASASYGPGRCTHPRRHPRRPRLRPRESNQCWASSICGAIRGRISVDTTSRRLRTAVRTSDFPGRHLTRFCGTCHNELKARLDLGQKDDAWTLIIRIQKKRRSVRGVEFRQGSPKNSKTTETLSQSRQPLNDTQQLDSLGLHLAQARHVVKKQKIEKGAPLMSDTCTSGPFNPSRASTNGISSAGWRQRRRPIQCLTRNLQKILVHVPRLFRLIFQAFTSHVATGDQGVAHLFVVMGARVPLRQSS